MEYELYHHGVKGMKWGVRRDRNKISTSTSSGKTNTKTDSSGKKKVAKDPEQVARNKAIAKKVAIGTIATATVATAAVLYAKNPAAANAALSKLGNTTVSALKKGKQQAKVTAAMLYVKGETTAKVLKKSGSKFVKKLPSRTKYLGSTAYKGLKDGVKQGVYNAPKRMVEALIVGATLEGARRGLSAAVGRKEAERIIKG